MDVNKRTLQPKLDFFIFFDPPVPSLPLPRGSARCLASSAKQMQQIFSERRDDVMKRCTGTQYIFSSNLRARAHLRVPRPRQRRRLSLKHLKPASDPGWQLLLAGWPAGGGQKGGCRRPRLDQHRRRHLRQRCLLRRLRGGEQGQSTTTEIKPPKLGDIYIICHI